MQRPWWPNLGATATTPVSMTGLRERRSSAAEEAMRPSACTWLRAHYPRRESSRPTPGNSFWIVLRFDQSNTVQSGVMPTPNRSGRPDAPASDFYLALDSSARRLLWPLENPRRDLCGRMNKALKLLQALPAYGSYSQMSLAGKTGTPESRKSKFMARSPVAQLSQCNRPDKTLSLAN